MSNGSPANLRVVFDTNVYIAAYLKPGLSEELVRRGLKQEFLIFISPAILTELEIKLHNKFNAPSPDREHYLDLVRRSATLVAPKTKVNVIKQDSADNKVLECALEAKAQLIITLDKDLLKLKTWKKIGIVHPKTFTWIVPKS